MKRVSIFFSFLSFPWPETIKQMPSLVDEDDDNDDEDDDDEVSDHEAEKQKGRQ